MSRMARKTIAGLVLGTFTLVVPSVSTAHTPTTSTARLYSSDNQSLPWDFPATYPSWVQSAAKNALDTNHSDTATNNSRSPDFTYTSGGSGDVFYSGSSSSPCGTGNLDWLQCANGGGTTTWNIYIRNFSAAPRGSWTWYDINSACNTSTQTCWYARRALIHEVLHVTMGAGHDSQGESNTVMASVTPWYSNTGWNQTKLRRCDEAAAQLLYDLRTSNGPYGNCFDHIAGHGIGGLITAASVSLTSYTVCIGFNAATSGRIAVKTDTDYKELSGNTLTGRTVWFDRKLSSSSTWSTNVHSVVATSSSGSNWSRSISNPGSGNGTWNYRVHMDGEAGLDPSNKPTFNITWTNSALVCA